MNCASVTTAKALLLSLLLAGANGSVSQDVHYSWTNERGETVFSDRPPPKGVDYELISSKSSSKRSVAAEEGAVRADMAAQSGAEATQAEKAKIQKNAQLCARAQANLEALSGSAEIRVRNAQGEVYTLSPEELVVQRQTAEAQVSVYCD